MSYGPGDPEMQRRLERLRMEQARLQGANPQNQSRSWMGEVLRSFRPTPELPPDAPGRDILDPSDPGYSRRHGGTIPTGFIGGIEALVTGPGRAYRGEMSREQMYDWGPEAAGGMTLGAAGVKAPANALRSGPARRSNSGALYPEYAETYPPLAPPVPTLKDPQNPAKGTYLAKALPAETEAFKKERARIQKEIDAGNYQPYFDPAQRADVDPAHYPMDVDTSTVRPKTAAKVEEHTALAAGPESLARLRAAYETGRELPDAKNWYYMKQLEDEFIKELGPEAGRAAFKEKFAGAMAATTGGADPQGNFLMAMLGNYRKARGQRSDIPAYEMPFPVGGRYASGNMEMFQKTIADEGGFGFQNPKRHDFQYNFLGHPNAPVMDEQMTGILIPGKAEPPWYGVAQDAVRKLADEYGVPSRELQEVAWAGAKRQKDLAEAAKKGKTASAPYAGQPMISTVNESIERTARLTGLSKAEVVRRGIIRSEIPMYAGGVPLPLAYKPRDEEER